MSFVECYSSIEEAFEKGQGVNSNLGDVLKPGQPGLPPLETPVGQRIENELDIQALGEFGNVAVSYLCKVVKPSPADLKGAFPLEAFNHRDGMRDPSIRVAQEVSWEGLKGTHTANIWTAFDIARLEGLDETGGLLDYRVFSRPPSLGGKENLLFYSAVNYVPDANEHQTVLSAIGETNPNILAHINQPTRAWDRTGLFVGQTALQFEIFLGEHLAT
jgi:hypothetical protein